MYTMYTMHTMPQPINLNTVIQMLKIRKTLVEILPYLSLTYVFTNLSLYC